MQNRRPAQFNMVPNDPSGNTWALPKNVIVRFGKGLKKEKIGCKTKNWGCSHPRKSAEMT